MAGSHDEDARSAHQPSGGPGGFATGDERIPEPKAPAELELDLDLPNELEARLRRAHAGAAAGDSGTPGSGAQGEAMAGDPAESAAPPDPLAKLSAELESARAEAATHRDKWLRAMAELENFRKRARREMETSILLANARLLRELLEVQDNFERALLAAPEGAGETLTQGVRLIHERFREILRQNGVVRIEAENAPFDPNLHEAISQVERDGVPSHQVVEVAQAGYMLGDIVLRPARVVVAK